MITEAALARVVQEVIALGDITEVESHRLAELCRILTALEGLFIEDKDGGDGDGEEKVSIGYAELVIY